MNTFEFYEDLEALLDKHNPTNQEMLEIGITIVTKNAVDLNVTDETINNIFDVIKESINHFKEKRDQ